MNSHQIVDLIMLAVLLYCAVRGASRGLLSQLAWVVALVLCFRFSGVLAPAIEPMIAVDPPLKQWIAMLAVYIGLCGCSFVAAGLLSPWMEKARIRDFDRHLGGLLGFVKGIVICMTAMYFVITMSPTVRKIVSQTYSGYAAAVILDKSKYLISFVPRERVHDVQEVIDRFNMNLHPAPDDLNGATPTGPGWNGPDGQDEFLNGPDESEFDLTRLLRPGKSPSGEGDSAAPAENGVSPATPENDRSLEDLLGQLPGQLRRQLSQSSLDVLRNSTREEREQLMDQLSRVIPDDAGDVLNDFLAAQTEPGGQGTGPTSSGRPSAPPPSLGRVETRLLNEIASIYDGRYDIVPRTRSYLAGVPPNVQRRVLEDWHADAMGVSSDPDPATDENTPLDERIVRQLDRAGIALNRLDRDLRNRLTQLLR